MSLLSVFWINGGSLRTRSNLLRLNGSSFGTSEWLFLEEQQIAEDLESLISKIREGDDIDNEFNIVQIDEHEFQTKKPVLIFREEELIYHIRNRVPIG